MKIAGNKCHYILTTALVVPVAIENSWKIVRFGMFPLTTGNALKWTVLKPIEPGVKTPNDITLEVENEIRKVLGQPMAQPAVL